jgi:hypothetical protein
MQVQQADGSMTHSIKESDICHCARLDEAEQRLLAVPALSTDDMASVLSVCVCLAKLATTAMYMHTCLHG